MSAALGRTVVLVIALLVGMSGCASTSSTKGPDITGGLRLELYVRAPGQSFVRYRVEPDGVLSFAGGINAQRSKWTWSGPMTELEIDHLLALLDEHRWLDRGGPPRGDGAEGHAAEVTIRRGGERHRFKVQGQSVRVTPIQELLAGASARRNEAFMQQLPRAGQQPR